MNGWLHDEDVSLLFEQLVNISYPFCRWDMSFMLASVRDVFSFTLFSGLVFTSMDRMSQN